MSITVTRDNFIRAETDRYFAALVADASGINRWHHQRDVASIDHQTVIRLNRDTLYSMAVVDISEGATVTLPDAGARYLSVMVVDQDHYVTEVLHDPGTYELSVERHGTPYVVLAARVLVDASDHEDLRQAAAVQDGLQVTAAAARPFVAADYDQASLDAVRNELLAEAGPALAAGRLFGRREEVDPERHRIGTAAGWGGLPDSEARYLPGVMGMPLGEYRLTVKDVPVDAFWSISVYNAAGYFEPNERDAYNVNSVSGVKDADGSMTVHFGGCDDGRVNCLPIVEGWNYLIRLYRPRPEVADGSFRFPEPERLR